MSRQAYRASLLHLLDDPQVAPESFAWHEDGLLVVEDGHVADFGAYEDLAPRLGATPVTAFPGKWIIPGFVDAHIHFPQVDVIASWGAQLLDWLNDHTFPVEAAFADPAHSRATAEFFLDELLRNGTTTALVFATVHKGSADALFEAALARHMRLVAGKVLMDRNAPPELCDTVESGRADSEALIRAWHGRGRLGYAVTPRFAVTSTPEQLSMAGELAAAHPDVLIHTHMSENLEEIATVAALFPEARDYLDVYARHGLLTRRSVFAHCVHASEAAMRRMAQAGAAIAFCPSSNLMLGSGLFSLRRACACGVTTALGTDVGAGASFSMPKMMAEAYRVGQVQHEPLAPLHAFYLATLAGARALRLDDRVGNLAPGREADFLVIDPGATPLLARRVGGSRTLDEKLFALTVLADDRCVARTYLAGRLAFDRRDGKAAGPTG